MQDRLKGFSYDLAYLHCKHMLERREKVHLYRNKGWQRAVEKYDLLLDYRETIPVEEQVGAFIVLSWHFTEDNRTFKLTVVGVYEFSLRSI